MNHPRIVVTVATSLCLTVGCGKFGLDQSTQPGPDSDTDGVLTTSAGSDDADGTEGTEEPDYYCIFNSANPEGLEGIKHQCDLEYTLHFSFTVDTPLGTAVEFQETTFSSTLADSTYEDPFVMACCTDITTAPGWPLQDTCETVHQRACMWDLIEHVCHAPGPWLLRFSVDAVALGANAMKEASEDFRTNAALRNECMDHFINGPDALVAADLCLPPVGAPRHSNTPPGNPPTSGVTSDTRYGIFPCA